MKTVVYQSFRTENVPPWIDACLATVRAWTEHQGFLYRFIDDKFFELVPPELRSRASEHKCLLTDFARLVAARELLAEGYDRVIWVDADLVVFDPEKFIIDIISGHAFCREVWHDFTLFGRPYFKLTVNNSVSVFCRDQQLIDLYLESATAILSGNQPLAAVSIGTEWLHQRQAIVPSPLLTNVGILGPEMMYRYLHEDARFLRPYLRYQTSPVYAANLCNSKLGTIYRFAGTAKAWELDDKCLSNLISRLCADKGASLNRHFTKPYARWRKEFASPLSRTQDWFRRIQLFSAHKLSLRLGRSAVTSH
jgi:hypothetical protein